MKNILLQEKEYNMDQVNVIITNVSNVQFSDKTQSSLVTRKYIDQKGDCFYGSMTNEAPVKSIINRVKDVQAIIFIESDTVRDFMSKKAKSPFITITHGDYLKKEISRFVAERGFSKPEYITTPIGDEPDEREVSKAVFDVFRKLHNYIVDEKNKDKDINIYIESNGGIRYVLTMLLSVTKSLENYYPNVHIKEITSMVLKQNPVPIKNTKQIFDSAQIMGIVDEFINYGRINSLKRYIKGYTAGIDPEIKKDISGVVHILSKTADDIQLCRTTMMLDDFYSEDVGLKRLLTDFRQKYSENEDAVVSVLKYLIEIMLEEFDKTIYYHTASEVKDSIINLLSTQC